jgi:uncharacterized protein (DUF2236 family)
MPQSKNMRRDDHALEAHRQAIRVRLGRASMHRAGPGSVTWKVNREIVVVAGWGRAILMQLAHPLVAAGVSDHSSFNRGLASSLGRLVSTIGAMLSLTFGSDDEAIDAAAGINRIHDRVLGHLPERGGAFAEGTPYSAHQAELLHWVHLTLLESIPLTYELLVGPLSAEELDRYCEEGAIMEPLLDIPPGTLPRRWSEVSPAIDAIVARQHVARTSRTRALGRDVLFPRGSAPLWPALRPVRLITIGLLSPTFRDIYGFSWTARDTGALRRWATAIRTVRRGLPAFCREWPSARRTRAGGHLCSSARPLPISLWWQRPRSPSNRHTR